MFLLSGESVWSLSKPVLPLSVAQDCEKRYLCKCGLCACQELLFDGKYLLCVVLAVPELKPNTAGDDSSGWTLVLYPPNQLLPMAPGIPQRAVA